jgi:protoheme IX farnesyltransferase
MTLQERDGVSLYRRTAFTAAVLAIGLIVLGGVVRITGSGLGCGDHWPRCNGVWFPPLDLPTLIEIGHRWVAALLTIAVSALTLIAWRRHRRDASLRSPATAAAVLLVVQILLGPVIVKLDLPPAVVVVHLLNAMVLLAALVVAVLRTYQLGDRVAAEDRHPAHGLIGFTTGFAFIVLLFGALVANLKAGFVCQGFPLCIGQLGPPATTLGLIHWTHRVLAFSLLALAFGIVRVLQRSREPVANRLRVAAWASLFSVLAQVGVAAAMVLSLLPTSLRALHLLAGTIVWVAFVVLLYLSRRTRGPAMVLIEDRVRVSEGLKQPSLVADLITLTKPRIISLLLVTTVAPMFITPAGLPSLARVLWVILGGYLMAGGANAINMWFDRDIDDLMPRTRLRPIPSGRLSPAAGLAFGIGLGVIAFAVLWHFVNQLSAWLALSGLLFYVFIYTIWLKRTSPQNIVIGGAAGAFPPLVGWAAMTGSLDLAAVYLFLIVFYWTPPHFWALALIKQGEYAKVGVPMLPVVRGNQHTKVQMLIYTLLLIPLTILPAFFGSLGLFYAGAAALLGARLLWYCIQLLREAGVTPTAWKMYRYSLLYLALLFVAMGIDRAVPFGHGPPPPSILILDTPDQEALAPVAGGPPFQIR